MSSTRAYEKDGKLKSDVQSIVSACEGLCYWDWEPFPCSIGIKGSEQKWKNHSGSILVLHLLLNDQQAISRWLFHNCINASSASNLQSGTATLKKFECGKTWKNVSCVCVCDMLVFTAGQFVRKKTLRDQHCHDHLQRQWAMDGMNWCPNMIYLPRLFDCQVVCHSDSNCAARAAQLKIQIHMPPVVPPSPVL